MSHLLTCVANPVINHIAQILHHYRLPFTLRIEEYQQIQPKFTEINVMLMKGASTKFNKP